MTRAMARSEKVSPTAYATGHLWVRLGLSHPAMSTPRGKRLDATFGLLVNAMRPIGGVSFDALMLARHKGIDALLTRAIDDGRVGQVIEIAAGLSGRGWRMTQKYGDRLTYIETDLPHMAALKRRLLDKAGLLSDRHRVLELNALIDDGPQSLAALVKTLDPKVGTAIITEGLMNYLDGASARGVWARIATHLKSFPQGLYLSDAYLRRERHGLAGMIFSAVLGRFVRGRIHIHFLSTAQGTDLMREAGFTTATIHETRDIPEIHREAARPGGEKVRVLEAWA